MKKLNKLSVKAKKEFEEIKYQFTIETLSKVRIEGRFLNLLENTYKKTTANNILNVKKLHASLLRSRIKQACSLLFNIILEDLPNAIWQEKEKKWIKIKNEEIKLSLFEDDMIVYVKTSKKSTTNNREPPKTSKWLQKSCMIEMNIQKLTASLNSWREQLGLEI